jgi:chemotaxis methyl-accepting protein methylase
LNEAFRAELLRIVALLAERHGVGVRGDELPRWLEERLTSAVQSLLAARRLELAELWLTLQRESDLVTELANALRVGETRFYRDAPQWEALRRHVVPALWQSHREAGRLTALSAGCSTGEEAWTLAMLLSEAAPRDADSADGPSRFRVVGIDRSEPALVTARSATYDQASGQRLPRELAQRFLVPSVDGSVQVVPGLRRAVTFQCRDLTRGAPPGHYDLIVCKNVLIYFGDEAQERVAQGLLRCLSDEGALLVARSEVPILRAMGANPHEIAPNVTLFRAR